MQRHAQNKPRNKFLRNSSATKGLSTQDHKYT